jgi:hypothetical protein
MIIIDKTALFVPQPSLERSTRLHPVFMSLDFATAPLLQIKVVNPTPKPQPGGPSICIYVPHYHR